MGSNEKICSFPCGCFLKSVSSCMKMLKCPGVHISIILSVSFDLLGSSTSRQKVSYVKPSMLNLHGNHTSIIVAGLVENPSDCLSIFPAIPHEASIIPENDKLQSHQASLSYAVAQIMFRIGQCECNVSSSDSKDQRYQICYKASVIRLGHFQFILIWIVVERYHT